MAEFCVKKFTSFFYGRNPKQKSGQILIKMFFNLRGFLYATYISSPVPHSTECHSEVKKTGSTSTNLGRILQALKIIWRLWLFTRFSRKNGDTHKYGIQWIVVPIEYTESKKLYPLGKMLMPSCLSSILAGIRRGYLGNQIIHGPAEIGRDDGWAISTVIFGFGKAIGCRSRKLLLERDASLEIMQPFFVNSQ